jgi:CRP-like cAMP-binding protein
MSAADKFSNLKTYYQQFLPGLSDESWQLCQSVLSVRAIKKGQMLVSEGSVCNHISFVNSGLFRMYHLVDGKEKILMFRNELNYLSDYRSFLLREPSLLYIQALEDSEVVNTSYEDLQMLYARVPHANMLGRLIAEDLFIDMCRRTTADASETLSERYHNLLDKQPWLVQRVPQYMIASYLGITPEALSRIKARARKKQARPVYAD